jgi:DNA-binding MarR family transcriptional regulator
MQDAIDRNTAAMREFQARAVLFQDAVARAGGLNASDLQAVGLLMSEGPATPGELAERIGLSAGGSITALVDRLERAGYVIRTRDETDRRRVLVSAVTERVFAAVGPIYGRVTEKWTAYLATLSADELELATAVLTRAAEINRDEIEHLRNS